MPRHEKPATSHKVTGPDQRPNASISLPPWPPCGCLIVAACVHIDPDAERLTEPSDVGPRCHGAGHDCGKYTTQQLAALGRRGQCCRDLDQQGVA